MLVEREAPGGQAGQSSRIENYLGFPAGLSGLRPRPPRDRPGAPARRRAAHRPATPSALRVEGAGRVVELERRRRAERELRARRLRRLLPPARHARVPGAHRRRHLLRRGDDRGALVPRPARRRHRRRELGRAGGGLLQRVRAAGDDARARPHARGVDVALPDRADRATCRTSRSARAPPRSPPRARTGTCARLRVRGARRRGGPADADACFVFIGAAPRTDWLDGVVARDERGFILAGRDAQDAGWPLQREPYLLETTVPGVFVAGDVRARSIKRVASAVGEGSMAVSLDPPVPGRRMTHRDAHRRRPAPASTSSTTSTTRSSSRGSRRPPAARRRGRATIIAEQGERAAGLQLLLEGDAPGDAASTATAPSRSAASTRRRGWARSRRSPASRCRRADAGRDRLPHRAHRARGLPPPRARAAGRCTGA